MRDSGSTALASPVAVVGRYAIFDRIASGGMATVHLGRLLGSGGFLRTVAIKRLHPQFAHDQEFTSMLLDEARLVTRIQHPNVVPTLDVVAEGDELLLVMEYVRGISLDRLTRTASDRKKRLPPNVAVSIVVNMLSGLHAAHEARDERRMPLGLVHRDVSPHNILVGADGVSRVLDFGIAKAEGRTSTTREGQLKGKIRYMAPEQITGTISRAVDVYAAGIVLFETLTCERMFGAAQEVEAAYQILEHRLRLPSQVDPSLGMFDDVFRRATAAAPADRYPTAKEMADDLEKLVTPASFHEVSSWVDDLVRETLDDQAEMVARIERSTTVSKIPIALQSAKGLAMPRPDHINAEDETITSASVGTRDMVVPMERGRTKLAIGAAALALAGVIAFAALRREPTTASSARQDAPTTAAPTPTPSERSIPSVDTPATPVPSAAASSAPPVIAAVATASASPVKAPTVTSARAHAEAASPPAAKPAKPSCDPPYTVDADGHRHFILECMK